MMPSKYLSIFTILIITIPIQIIERNSDIGKIYSDEIIMVPKADKRNTSKPDRTDDAIYISVHRPHIIWSLFTGTDT